jgi:hypothetical protein
MSMERDEGPFPRRLTIVQGLLGIVLRLEALAGLLFPLILGLGLIGSLGLLGILDRFPAWLHGGLLFLVFAGSFYWVFRNYRVFHWPAADDVWRRIEKASRFSHRPLAQLTDQQATNLTDPLARSLWKAHRQELARHITSLRLGWPHFRIAERDPWALRTIVLLLVG